MSGADAPFPLVLSAPSGAGKTTLANLLRRRNRDVAFSVSATVASSLVKASVTMFPSCGVARMPPLSANAAMKPTCVGSVVTAKCFAFRQPIVPFAVKGLFDRAPQPAASSAMPTVTSAARRMIRL